MSAPLVLPTAALAPEPTLTYARDRIRSILAAADHDITSPALLGLILGYDGEDPEIVAEVVHLVRTALDGEATT